MDWTAQADELTDARLRNFIGDVVLSGIKAQAHLDAAAARVAELEEQLKAKDEPVVPPQAP